MTTPLAIWGLKAVKAIAPAQRFLSPKNIQLPVIDSSQVLGIEVEVENQSVIEGAEISRIWTIKDDGSLRNNGAEWVSAPMMASYVPAAIHNLFSQLSPDCCFGPRTSIHVHLNMQDWEEEQIQNLVLWYCVFERIFYRFTGRHRQENIYCVPLLDTNLLAHLKSYSISSWVDRWSKYTGLNLIPLTNYGTIEFRHMHGTFKTEKICVWVRILCRLCEFVKNHTPEYHQSTLMSLDSNSSELSNIFNEIFKEELSYLKTVNLGEDTVEPILRMKSAFTPEPIPRQVDVDFRISPYILFK